MATRKEELEMIAEQVCTRLLNSAFKGVVEKYETLVQEKMDTEMDKFNQTVKDECPEYGAVVINLDGCELSFPYTGDTFITIDNGDKKYELEANGDVKVEELIALMTEGEFPFVKVISRTKKDMEFYNKKKLYDENEQVKETKVYTKVFEGMYPKNKICAVYKVSGHLD
jgi:hypothetical protein